MELPVYYPIKFHPKTPDEEESYTKYLSVRTVDPTDVYLEHNIWGKMTWKQFDDKGNGFFH